MMLDHTIFDVPKICPTNRNAETSDARVVMPDIKTDIRI
jgi:hypothetical protein